MQVLTLKRLTIPLQATKKYKTRHGGTPPFAHFTKEMDTLSLGVYHVIPCRVLWFFGRVSIGT